MPIFIFVLLTLAVGCKEEEKDTAPVVSTLSVNNVTSVSAEIVCMIFADEQSAAVTSSGVCWSTNSEPILESSESTDEGKNSGPFTSFLTSLTPGTKYFARAYASYKGGTVYGNEITFTTHSTLPILTTLDVTETQTTAAKSGGTLISNGGSSITALGLCWSTIANPTVASGNHVTVDPSVQNFVGSMAGLSPGTTYFVKAFATNEVGTGYGNEISFITVAVTPGTLTTAPATDITSTTVVTGGTVTNDGGSPITERGVCWSTMPDPVKNPVVGIPNSTSDGAGTGHFVSTITGLTPATTYYIRAYSANSTGISYGNEVSFTTSSPVRSTVTDIDGNTYGMVEIGTQIWMSENLKTTRYRDGSSIPEVTGAAAWSNLSSGAYSIYDNDGVNDVYGKLYNYFAVIDSRRLCPTGTHVPTVEEWRKLVEYIGGETYAGDKLKESGPDHWPLGNPGTNTYDFTALPGGSRWEDGSFHNLGTFTRILSTSVNANTPEYIWSIYVVSTDPSAFVSGGASKKLGGSVRCLAD